ncbi:fimbrial biogenesis outer membrane usher protein [Pseudomonas sp. FW306-02-F02-AA]|uniref:Fimbrial protein n=1 Tax=Pseudomonas fluorescens TaxID=294 RepID=A0A0N9W7N1_PSEFL|nr:MULTISPECIES: fimbria/pilus outer membrane usher protein [Pseudomonas]ALI02889.1 fimbrial protein [Pseudomonas fluorescens]PMZ04321.1 fimbrial biogenesis outer membrane usher protein [Pseudomonas sp. FW306-02-F02-AB]PMZ10596.1 fimbrial biogenesis outer membrane usher protein [Pseudomonas sp. FW306-02-H06C]PMZ15990.1 fimbrial biogenesis outer membrane usher protein [Pseudomonas sp. FW306-02-F02-AA]PMZ21918.1 fimbrial biogenesis outer membrane usher protein [Pseudomonas sp. FW306-02-F08-AA]
MPPLRMCVYARLSKYWSCFALITSGLTTTAVYADYSFDASFLEIGGGNTSAEVAEQVKTMSQGQLPGIYRVNVTVDNRMIEQRDVRFVRETAQQKPTLTGLFPCLSIDQLTALGVDPARLAHADISTEQCVYFNRDLAGVTYTYDFHKQRLDLQIPQAFVGSVPFATRRKRWSDGEQVAFANYSFSGSQYQTDYNNRQSQFGSVRSGINTGAWRLRNFSNWQKSTNVEGQWKSLDTYVQRDMGNMMAIATIGESSTDSDLFDSISYRGIGIESDLDMLPEESRNFAPVVRGVANGRSLVTLRQRGYVISEQWVPSGPFALKDLYSTPSNGDIEVTVQGPNGERQVYTQSFSSVPYMMREGQQSYSLTAGQYRPADGARDQAKPAFVLGTLRRGLSDGTTLFGGALVSDQYKSSLLGFAHDYAGFGAISLDVTHAVSDDLGPERKTLAGQSYRFRYSKTLSLTDTNFSLIGYRYSTSGYYSFSEANNARANRSLAPYVDESLSNGEHFSPYLQGHMKSSFTANVSQQFGNYGGLYANLTKTAYWNMAKSNTSIQLGYSFSVGRASYNLGLAQNGGSDDDIRSLSLSVSLPLGDPGSSSRIGLSNNQDSNGNATRAATFSGSSFKDDALSYSLGVNQQLSDEDRILGGSVAARYNAANAIWHGSYNQDRNTRQMDYGVEGGVVAMRDTLMFTQPLGETNIIVATPGAADVGVLTRSGVRTNNSGYTIISSAQPYRDNRVSLDTDSLSDNVDIAGLVQEVTPKRGAFVMARFKTQNGRRLLVTVETAQGMAAPFAANVQLFDSTGAVLSEAMVADKGRVFITGVPEQSRLVIKVNGKTWCRQDLDLSHYTLPQAGIGQFKLTCNPTTGASDN